MLDAFFEKVLDMFVIQSIKQSTVLAADVHQFEIAQSAQVVANARWTHAEQFGNIAHTKLTVRERPNDLDAGGVP